MAHSEQRILEAMLRVQASEHGWAGHMFVFPTDHRLRLAALASGHVCRLIDDDGLVVMCRDASSDGTPWAPSTSTIPAIDRGFGMTELGRRAAEAVERAVQSATAAREVVLRSRAAREASGAARAHRMRFATGV